MRVFKQGDTRRLFLCSLPLPSFDHYYVVHRIPCADLSLPEHPPSTSRFVPSSSPICCFVSTTTTKKHGRESCHKKIQQPETDDVNSTTSFTTEKHNIQTAIIMTATAAAAGDNQCEVVLVGCGAPKRGMGWYVLNGCPKNGGGGRTNICEHPPVVLHCCLSFGS